MDVLALRPFNPRFPPLPRVRSWFFFGGRISNSDNLRSDGPSLRSRRLEAVGTKKKRAREKETREGRLSACLPRARRSLFHPLLPSAAKTVLLPLPLSFSPLLLGEEKVRTPDPREWRKSIQGLTRKRLVENRGWAIMVFFHQCEAGEGGVGVNKAKMTRMFVVLHAKE